MKIMKSIIFKNNLYAYDEKEYYSEPMGDDDPTILYDLIEEID